MSAIDSVIETLFESEKLIAAGSGQRKLDNGILIKTQQAKSSTITTSQNAFINDFKEAI